MQKQFETGLMWFRRDLRVDDNAALFLGLQSCRRLYCAFVFDTDLLAPLPRADRRVEFIRESLVDLEQALRGVAITHEAAQHIGRGGPAVDQIAQQIERVAAG